MKLEQNNVKFAWLQSENQIDVILENNKEFKTDSLNIYDHNGNKVALSRIEQKGHDLTIVIDPASPLKPELTYCLTSPSKDTWCYPSLDYQNKNYVYEGELGLLFKDQQIIFRLWSPTARKVWIRFYDKTNPELELDKKELQAIGKGVWELNLDRNSSNLIGNYYLYEIEAFGTFRKAMDPYAKTMKAFNPKLEAVSKAAITPDDQLFVEMGPYKHNRDFCKSPLDFVGYEVNIRDFTISKKSKVKKELRGTFLGMLEKIDHLKKLNISHVQLMPIHSCHTTNELQRRFQDDKTPQNEINYNWGYDTHHFFVLEGRYTTDPENPATRVKELKTLVKELKNANIGVVIDVVYNHIYKRETFEDIAPGCYLRRELAGYISGKTGAGDSIETRNLMVRKLIVESIMYLKNEFHVGGVRFDLMGFIDKECMAAIRAKVGDDFIMYGEAWEFSDLPGNLQTTKTNLPHHLDVGAFNDTCRDSYTGAMSDRGFAQGHFYNGPKVRSGIIGAIKDYPTDYNQDGHLDVFLDQYPYNCFAVNPIETINYLSIHDGFTLWDKINISIKSDIVGMKKIVKLAMAMLLTSQGRVVIHGGDEIGRSKPLGANDPNKDRAHTSDKVLPDDDGIKYFHENSYRSPDFTNCYNWDRAEDFMDVFEYVQGLLHIRRKFSCFRYQKADSIRAGVRFVCENIPNSAVYSTRANTRHSAWKDMEYLKIEFVHGPPNTSLYLIGEIHRDAKNPNTNPYRLDFNAKGEASIRFEKDQIEKFDFKGWGGDSESLKVKLVNEAGSWAAPKYSYTSVGCNTIHPSSVKLDNNTATLDLAIINHVAGDKEFNHKGHIAFYLDNTIEESDPSYDQFLVIHNAEKSYIELEVPGFTSFAKKEILVDNLHAGLRPLIRSSVEFIARGKEIKVPPKTTTIIGLKKA